MWAHWALGWGERADGSARADVNKYQNVIITQMSKITKISKAHEAHENKQVNVRRTWFLQVVGRCNCMVVRRSLLVVVVISWPRVDVRRP